MSQPEPGTDLQPAERVITMFVTNGVAIGSANLVPLSGQALVSDQQGGGGGVSN